MTIGAFVATALLAFVPLEQAQAQLIIDVYPSQDHTNQTLWIFSGSSTVRSGHHIRTGSTSASPRDSWGFANNNFFNANRANDQLLTLSPLFSSTNTIDIDSIRKRIPGGGRTNITFAANATNTPTITIGSGSRTISRLFLDDNSGSSDQMGIRVSGSNLSYSSGNSSAWAGAGILNKPIGDFSAGTHNNASGSFTTPNFVSSTSSGLVQVRVNSAIIPEPQEYALIFGLFALGFVFFHRRRMQETPPLCSR